MRGTERWNPASIFIKNIYSLPRLHLITGLWSKALCHISFEFLILWNIRKRNAAQSNFFLTFWGMDDFRYVARKLWQISKEKHLLEKESIQRMQNRQKGSLHRGRPRHNRLTGFSSAPVVFLCQSNYHVRLIVLLMTVINQVLLPNLWISSSLQYTRAGHTGW